MRIPSFSMTRPDAALRGSSCLGAGAVALTLVLNLARGYPLASLAAALAIAGGLYVRWLRTGRRRGVAEAERVAEEKVGTERPSEA
jgi:hypothetical protein